MSKACLLYLTTLYLYVDVIPQTILAHIFAFYIFTFLGFSINPLFCISVVSNLSSTRKYPQYHIFFIDMESAMHTRNNKMCLFKAFSDFNLFRSL